MNQLVKDLGIDEKLIKPRKKQVKFNKVKDNIPLVEDYNYQGFRMGDLRWSKEKKKIVQVLLYPGTAMRYRYMLDKIKNASFAETEIKK